MPGERVGRRVAAGDDVLLDVLRATIRRVLAALGRTASVDRAGVVVEAVDWRMATALRHDARVERARVVVVAADPDVQAAGCRIAAVGRAQISVVAGDRGPCHAGPAAARTIRWTDCFAADIITIGK